MSRPYLSRPIAELEELFEESSGDRVLLDALVAELQSRKTERARHLLARVLACRAGRVVDKTTNAGDNVVQLALSFADRFERRGPSIAEGILPQEQERIEEAATRPQSAESRRIAENFGALRAKLLQLSRNNPMLNYRPLSRSRRHIAFVNENLESAYSRLASEDGEVIIAPLPEPSDIPLDERNEEFEAQLAYLKATDIEYQAALSGTANNARDDQFELLKLERALRNKLRAELAMPPTPKRKEINIVGHAKERGIEPNYDLAQSVEPSKGRGGQLQSMMLSEALQARMGSICDLARLSEQEMGFSTLFLAFGFLEWYDSDISAEPAFAPLILLPVTLSVHPEGGKKMYSLKATSEDAAHNITLAKKLGQFGRVLDPFDPSESTARPIEDFIEKVRRGIDGLPNWKVRRYLILGHFAFGRLAMHQDLDPAAWGDLTAHKLVAGVLRGALTVERGADSVLTRIPEDFDIDTPEVEHDAPILIHNADASQHSAIVDVMRRNDLVVSGPPGTGKSQTITNIIANALAKNQDATVLFLSEKMAALEVVKRRLDAAGLSGFSLELHADKSSPKKVVKSLRDRLDATTQTWTNTGASQIAWTRARDSIKGYIEALHEKDPGGATAFDLFWESVALDRTNGAFPANIAGAILPPDLLSDIENQTWLLDEVDKFGAVAHAFEERYGPLLKSPWNRLPLRATPGEHAHVVTELSALRSAIDETELVVREAQDAGLASESPAWTQTVLRLPAPPDLEGIDKILSVEPVVGATAAIELRRLREIEAALSADALFQSLGREKLSRAQRFANRVGRNLDRSPAEILNEAKRTWEQAEDTLRQIEDSRSVRDALAIADNAPLKILPAVWAAALLASTIPVELHEWMQWKPDTDEDSFQRSYADWTRLKKTDDKFNRSLPGYAPESRPDPARLREAAAVLDERMIGLKFWRRDALTQARSVASELGVLENASDTLRSVADHVDKLNAFENDKSHASAAGPLWAGMQTQFDRMSDVLGLKTRLAKELNTQIDGPLVAGQLFSIASQAVATLARTRDIAKEQFSKALRFKYDGAPIGETQRNARQEATASAEILQSEDASGLSEIAAPLSKILGLARLVSDRDTLNRGIENLRAGRQLLALIRDPHDAERLIAQFNWIETVHQIGLPSPLTARLRSASASECREGLLDLAERLRAAFRAEEEIWETLAQKFGLRRPDLSREALVEAIDAALARNSELRDYLGARQEMAALTDHGLGDFIKALEVSAIPPERYSIMFRHVLTRRRAERVHRKRPALQAASGITLDGERRTFRNQDSLKIKQDRIVVRRKLLERHGVPGSALGKKKEWTEMALIHHELGKQGAFLNVRALLRQAGHSIRALKPCFMMSPMTVSKFLPRDMVFDLVIIDEASQMRPEDALGALLRARQIVVVGDAKQLPPTGFFDRAMDDAEFDDENEDGDDQVDESILEACIKSFDRVRHLKWHYRSRCESLIDFSNEHFYSRSLITFPMARPGSFSVDLVRVNGTYQAGVNEAEAQRIAEEAVALIERLADADDAEFGTAAIVAVNQKQREAILRQFELASSGNEAVLRYMERSEEQGEPFIIKNLENIQGDERDFILISLTYGSGPNKTVVDQRFGPINKAQGHRRLNVLFSRARRRIGLFTSMNSKDVRPAETSNEGVRVLKAYLEYAERAGTAGGKLSARGHDSPFEREVADRLTEWGFDVDVQVGVSQFRIDLAVRHRKSASIYVVGIECDGAAYHSTRSARDRDRLREDVLTSLGWKIIRVWSTDWFADPNGQTLRLVTEIERLEAQEVRPFEDVLFGRGSVFVDRPEQADQPATPIEQPVHAPAPAVERPPEAPAAAAHAHVARAASPPLEPRKIVGAAPPGAALLGEDRPLSKDEARLALEAFRKTVIEVELPEAVPHRSILRESMIECFLSARFDDPDDWLSRIPMYLRQGTDPGQRKYLGPICDIVARIR